jgi:hypothetical protein
MKNLLPPLSVENVKRSLPRVVQPSAKGIFPPIGIVSILALTVLTVGVPNWGANRNLWPCYVFLACAILFGFLLWKIPRERYSALFASIFGWIPVTLGALTYIFWYWYAIGNTPGDTFFHAAADVLPIILLATVVDVRRTKDLEGKQLVLPIAAVFLGELAALNVLAFGDAGPEDFAAVASSFVTAIVALVLAVMADLASSDEDEHKTIKTPPPRAVVEVPTNQTGVGWPQETSSPSSCRSGLDGLPASDSFTSRQ